MKYKSPGVGPLNKICARIGVIISFAGLLSQLQKRLIFFWPTDLNSDKFDWMNRNEVGISHFTYANKAWAVKIGGIFAFVLAYSKNAGTSPVGGIWPWDDV
jgi:hypothetical protein